MNFARNFLPCAASHKASPSARLKKVPAGSRIIYHRVKHIAHNNNNALWI